MTGFDDPERAARQRPAIEALPGGAEAMRLVEASADPDLALVNLARYAEAAGALPGDARAAVLLFAGSQSMSEAAIRDPELLERVLADRVCPGAEELRRRAEPPPGADVRRHLRRFVRTESLRVLLGDFAGVADLPETAARLSRIAEAAIDAALRSALRDRSDRHGPPRREDGTDATITVIGMGKLGGGELNYSSDIDLIFLYSGDGRTAAPDPGRALSNLDFFSRVVTDTRALLADATPDGHCYRVDLRLRPEGRLGKVTRTVESALRYYRKAGRIWERQAFIKARPVAGDLRLGAEAFLAPLADFVYGARLRTEDIARMRELRREGERRVSNDRQVKAGPGGIRDVEFTVQFLQLLHGREIPAVREPATLPALDALAAAQAITETEARPLADGYRFLRLAEHRVQTLHEIRTHSLPAHDDELRRLALRMGIDGDDPAAELRARYGRHTSEIRRIRDELFHGLFLGESGDAELFSDFVLEPGENRAGVLAWFTERRFERPEQAVAILEKLASLGSPRARKFFASLCPHLVLRVIETPDPDRCLINLERIVASIRAPATFYKLLSEYGDILSVYTDICGWSQHLAEILVREPAMLDAFADSLVIPAVKGRQPWDDLELDEIEEADDPAAVLASLKDLSLARIGVRDIQGRANLTNTSRDLTQLAEYVVRRTLARARAEVERRFGPTPEGDAGRFAVLALGRLGAGEMSYASDLDVVFVADDASERHVRVAQRIVRLLADGPRGRIYEVDPRVRPYGRSGPLVTAVAGFGPYYRERAHVSELQMLTKARPIAGDESLRRELARIVERVLYDAPPRPGLADEVRTMRGRLERRARGRDVKRGFGGIVDVEFVAEFLKLAHGHRLPRLRRTDTLGTIGVAHREGLLNHREHSALLTALMFLRSVESRIRIVWDMAGDRIPEDAAERGALARRLGYVDSDATPAGDALLSEYEYHTRRTREVFEAVLERGSPGRGGSEGGSR